MSVLMESQGDGIDALISDVTPLHMSDPRQLLQFSWVSLNKVVLWGYFLPLWTSIFRNGFPSWWQLWLLGFEERFVPSHFTRLRPQQEPLLRTAELQVANWLPQVLPLLSLCFINVIESGSRASRLLSFSSLPYCLSFFFCFWPMTHIPIQKRLQ